MISYSPKETFQFGFNLASQIAAGSVIALSGGLGTGKTLLARGICCGLGYKGDVTSPSYVGIHTYPHSIPIYHADLYLSESDNAVIDLGLEELFESDCVVIVEWAHKFPHLLPKSCLWIDIEWCDGEKEMRKIDLKYGVKQEL